MMKRIAIPALLLLAVAMLPSSTRAQEIMAPDEQVAPPAAPPVGGPYVPSPSDAAADVTGEQAPKVQNAVVEGIQLSSEAGEKAGEKVVTCYFIFRDKPSSYFYNVNQKEKKMVFEFNDTEMGSSPIASVAEAPISGFELQKKRVNVNELIKGLTPEWHDLVQVTFALTDIPKITVTDQYNIITFSYKWNPADKAAYTEAPKKHPAPIVLAATGGGLVVGGIIAAVLIARPPAVVSDKPLPINDLPDHQTQDQ